MNPQRIKWLLAVAASLPAALLLLQLSYGWTLGLAVGVFIAWTSCRFIEHAVRKGLVRNPSRRSLFFLAGFFARFALFAAILYVALVYAKVNPIAIVISFTIVQLTYPIYRVRKFEKRDQHA